MAISLVKETNANSSSSSTTLAATLSSAPTAGNLLVFAMAGDKNTGTLTLSGFTKLYDLPSSSVSLYVAYKVSDGTETTINPSWSSSSSAGNTAWYAEYQDAAVAGSTWDIVAQASNITNESTTTSQATGTTGAKTFAGHGLAFDAIDSSQSVTTVNAWGNSYSIRYSGTGHGGKGGVFVAEKAEASGGTTSSTFNYTGTADQNSAAIFVFRKVDQNVISLAAEADIAQPVEVAMGYTPRMGNWRWYNDAATDGAMTAQAAENTAMTLTGAQMQNAKMRLRMQINELGGGGNTQTLTMQYRSPSAGTWTTVDAQVPVVTEGIWFRFANGAATAGNTVGSQLLTGTTVSGTYIEASGNITVNAYDKREIDIALLMHWPPPDSTVEFRVLLGGTPLAGGTTITLNTSTAADRPNTVTRIDGDSSQKTSREIRFAPWRRVFYDSISSRWWMFVVQYDTPSVIRSYYWNGSGAWTAGATLAAAPNCYQSRAAFVTKSTGSGLTVYAHYGTSSSTRYMCRGTIAGTTLTWGTERNLSQATDRHTHIAVDDGGYLWIVGTTASTGIWVRRSTNVDDMSTWNAAINIADTGVISGDIISVIGLASDKCLVLWKPNGASSIKYSIVSAGAGSAAAAATDTANVGPEDWGIVRAHGYVYLIHSDATGSGGNWVLRVFNETLETWLTGTSPGLSGQPSSNDGIPLTSWSNGIYAFGTEAGVEGGQDRIIFSKKYTGTGITGSWGARTDFDGGGRVNSDHMSTTQDDSGSKIVVLSAVNDDDSAGNARTVEYFALSTSTPQNINVAQNTETDTAQTPTRNKSKGMGLAW